MMSYLPDSAYALRTVSAFIPPHTLGIIQVSHGEPVWFLSLDTFIRFNECPVPGVIETNG